MRERGCNASAYAGTIGDTRWAVDARLRQHPDRSANYNCGGEPKLREVKACRPTFRHSLSVWGARSAQLPQSWVISTHEWRDALVPHRDRTRDPGTGAARVTFQRL